MPAIGAHIPRADARYNCRRRATALGFDVEAGAVARRISRREMTELTAYGIRARVAADLEAIAEETAASDGMRAARRASAVIRRQQQRLARIAAGTDRATIRALGH